MISSAVGIKAVIEAVSCGTTRVKAVPAVALKKPLAIRVALSAKMQEVLTHSMLKDLLMPLVNALAADLNS